jgi:hypothetical protein
MISQTFFFGASITIEKCIFCIRSSFHPNGTPAARLRDFLSFTSSQRRGYRRGGMVK